MKLVKYVVTFGIDTPSSPEYEFLRAKQHIHSSGKLTCPTEVFVVIIKRLAEIFPSLLKKGANSLKMKCNLLVRVKFFHTCCIPV